MDRSIIFIPLSALALALPGCAVVTTEPIDGNASPRATGTAGVAYMLPKAILPVELVANGGSLRIDILEPTYAGDPDHVYTLRYVPSALSTDTAKIEVDPKTSLLKSVTLESKDETGEILKKAIATTVRAESAAGSDTTDVVLVQTVLDPSDLAAIAAVRAQLDAAASHYMAKQRRACTTAQTPAAYCADVTALSNEGSPNVALVVTAMGTDASRQAFNSSKPDCSAGLCYRATIPYRIDLGMFGQARSTLVQLPNNGPVVALPLARQPLVTVKHTVSMTSGMLASYETVKPSSALALVSWPLDVYDAVVTTTAKIIQLKIDTSRSSLALQQQMFDEAKKRKELEDQIKDLNAPKPESASLIGMGMGRSDALLTVGVGKPRSVLPSVYTGNSPQQAQPSPAPAGQMQPGRTLPGSAGTAGGE